MSGLAGAFEHGGRNKVGKGEATMTRREGKPAEEGSERVVLRRLYPTYLHGNHMRRTREYDAGMTRKEKGEGV